MTAKKKTVLLLVSIPFVAALAVPLYLLLAQAFSGPNCAAGQCNGAIGLDANNNLSIGTSTPQLDTKLLIVGTSTGSGYFAIKVIDTQRGPLFLVRSDGSVTIGSNQFAGGGTNAPGVGNNSAASGGLFVHGPVVSDLSISSTVISGNFTGTVSAGNVSNGVFGSNVGNGNYAFPASLGIGTSSQAGLPQALSVYGNGYVSGNLSVATTAVTNALNVQGNGFVSGYIGVGAPNPGGANPYGVYTTANMFANEYDTIGNQLSLGVCGIFESFGTSCATARGSGILGIYLIQGPFGSIDYQAGVTGNGQSSYAHYFETSSSSPAQTPGYLLGVASGHNTIPVFSIASSGNTGIGTTGTASRLSVFSLPNIDPSLTYRSPALFSMDQGNVELAGGTATTNPWAFWLQARQSGNTAWPLVLNPLGGNVGIGTAAPTYKLDVVGGVNITGALFGNGVKGMIFGGSFEYRVSGNVPSCPAPGFAAILGNPLTGGQSCPVGYSSYISYESFDSVNTSCMATCYR